MKRRGLCLSKDHGETGKGKNSIVNIDLNELNVNFKIPDLDLLAG